MRMRKTRPALPPSLTSSSSAKVSPSLRHGPRRCGCGSTSRARGRSPGRWRAPSPGGPTPGAPRAAGAGRRPCRGPRPARPAPGDRRARRWTTGALRRRGAGAGAALRRRSLACSRRRRRRGNRRARPAPACARTRADGGHSSTAAHESMEVGEAGVGTSAGLLTSPPRWCPSAPTCVKSEKPPAVKFCGVGVLAPATYWSAPAGAQPRARRGRHDGDAGDDGAGLDRRAARETGGGVVRRGRRAAAAASRSPPCERLRRVVGRDVVAPQSAATPLEHDAVLAAARGVRREVELPVEDGHRARHALAGQEADGRAVETRPGRSHQLTLARSFGVVALDLLGDRVDELDAGRVERARSSRSRR